MIIPDNFIAIFNKVIPNQSFLKGWFDLENYGSVKEKVGELNFDECYGYFPTLSMGGNESIENISIVKMIPYIDMNVQMIDIFERADNGNLNKKYILYERNAKYKSFYFVICVPFIY